MWELLASSLTYLYFTYSFIYSFIDLFINFTGQSWWEGDCGYIISQTRCSGNDWFSFFCSYYHVRFFWKLTLQLYIVRTVLFRLSIKLGKINWAQMSQSLTRSCVLEANLTLEQVTDHFCNILTIKVNCSILFLDKFKGNPGFRAQEQSTFSLTIKVYHSYVFSREKTIIFITVLVRVLAKTAELKENDLRLCGLK